MLFHKISSYSICSSAPPPSIHICLAPREKIKAPYVLVLENT